MPAIYAANSAGRFVRLTVLAATGGGYAAVNEFKVRGVFTSGAAPAAVPVITSALAASGQGAYPFSYQIAASNAPTGYGARGLPTGLSVNGVTGLISGTTSQSGMIPVTVSAINSGGAGSAVLRLNLAAPPPVPVVTSALTYSTQAGVAIAAPYTVTASNLNYTPASLSAALPANLGLAFNAASGQITGTPKYPGTYTVPLSGTNVSGPGPVANLAFTVTPNGPAPAINSASSASGYAGNAFSYQIAATNSPTLFGAGNLPAGLSVNTATGLISGTPTAAGNSTVTLTAANAGGAATANLALTVTVNPNAPAITSALTASGNVGTPFSYTIAATNSPTSLAAAPLPAGLTLNASVISGTPTAQGTTSVVLKAVNASGSDTKTLAVTIGAAVAPPVVNSPVNAVGAVNVPFAYQITGTNAPTAFAAAPLPAGLTLNPATGLISGTPTTAGTTAVSLTASNNGGASAARALNLVVSPAGSDINLALNQPVTTLDPPIGGNAAAYAVDGSPGPSGTRWESPHSDTEWITVDLGATCLIHAVNLDWEAACGQNYKVEVSSDRVTWTNFVAPVLGNKTSGWLYYTGTATGQFVRMNGSLRATTYGYSLYEYQVMGVVVGPGGLTAGPGAGAGQIALNWLPMTGAGSYTLQRSTSAASGFGTIGTVAAPTLAYTDADPALQANTTYYYRVAATTAQGLSGYSAPASAKPAVPLGRAGWRYRYFGQAGLNPTLANGAADNANPARDGFNNLTKYALGLDPTVNAYAASPGALPVPGRQTVGGADYLTLTFTGAASDVTYNVQAAGDLTGVWTTVQTYTGTAAVGTITAQDTQPVSASARRFLRLQVSAP